MNEEERMYFIVLSGVAYPIETLEERRAALIQMTRHKKIPYAYVESASFKYPVTREEVLASPIEWAIPTQLTLNIFGLVTSSDGKPLEDFEPRAVLQ